MPQVDQHRERILDAMKEWRLKYPDPDSNHKLLEIESDLQDGLYHTDGQLVKSLLDNGFKYLARAVRLRDFDPEFNRPFISNIPPPKIYPRTRRNYHGEKVPV